MRIKDDKKQQALFLATVKLVNEIGFAATSVSKIAREAGVSPATLYVYFKNKEDLLISTYMKIKEGMGETILENFDATRPLQEIFRTVWRNTFHYVSENLDEFRYAEQFSNSPYTEQVDKKKLEKQFKPLLQVIEKGKKEKILKDISLDIFGVFMFHPIMVLANPHHCKTFEVTEENIETAFTMAWDAVKL